MARAWKDRLARVRGAVDGMIGDGLRFTPQAGASQYKAAGPDPDRPAFDVICPFAVGTGEAVDVGGGSRASWAAQIPAGEAEAHIDPDAYPAALRLRKGDRVVALDRSGAKFEVARVDPGQRNRLIVRLNTLS